MLTSIFIVLVASLAIAQNNEHPELKVLFDKEQLKGSILIYDLNNKREFGYNLQRADSGFLPASTFKIPNTLIALDTKVMQNKNTIIKWDGKPRRMKVWDKDMTLEQAFHLSCVPCYQAIAASIGAERMDSYLNKLEYGEMTVSTGNLQLFWLVGESKISQRQQIDFLKRLYHNQLKVQPASLAELKEIMVIEQNEEYILSGKTGWAIRSGKNIGWFVGYYEIGDNVYFVATNVTPINNEEIKDFSKARRQITHKALQMLSILK